MQFFFRAALFLLLLPAADFDDTYRQLQSGRAYSKNVGRGEFPWKGFASGDIELVTTIVVPEDYDPQRNLRVLANPASGADGALYLSNLVNTPSYIVNGGRDPLYPVSGVLPYLEVLQRYGAPIEFRPQMQAGHDTSWWPEEGPRIDAFERAHPRDPYPDRLSWQTERTDRYNRFRWLVIDRLAGDRSESALPEIDAPEFRYRKTSGRVDLERTGNTVVARTRGVGTFTLLLSPEEFDFGQPVRVVVNGQPAFEGVVRKDVATLNRWAARDHDRTMLFGAELRIEVPRMPG